ncbi:MAG TPA: hypothetical protein VF844_11730 [Ktedonobacteraceae bacterium]
MDTSRDKPTGIDGNPYIWLRYTTQFSAGGRTHTIEMGIPVPLGASAETREQLIREAEMGMEQLTRRVESRVSQMLQRSARPPETARAQEPAIIRPGQASQQEPGSRIITGSPSATATRSTTPAPGREGPQPLPLHEKQPATMPVRQSGPVSMPVTPGMQGDASSNMKLSQFMQAIRDAWGLTPKQAMDLLNVKTLNGMNYREALRQLQPIVEGNARDMVTPGSSNNAPVSQPKPAEERGRTQGAPLNVVEGRGRPQGSPPPNSSSPQPLRSYGSQPPSPVPSKTSSPTPPARPAPGALAGPANIPVIPIKEEMIRDAPRRVYQFDEEDEELEEEKEEESEEQRVIARLKLDELKEVRGSSLASAGRLTVLQNVLNSQISEEQLQHLIQSMWGVTGVKKLKVDQVEALISWAKEDYFVEEVEAVLALIDGEESHARSDW